MPLSDWRDGENHADAGVAATEYGLDYLGGNIAGGEGFDWFYASDAERRAQVRTPISDGAYGEPWVWRYKDLHAFWSQPHHDRPGGVRSATPTAWMPRSKPIWLTELGCGAVDKGANQPNIFGDSKSAEGGRPYFSSGVPDGLIQRQFLRAHHRHWSDAGRNPAGMVDPERLYCWTWDARPFPSFPALEEVWSDGPNHRHGHWLTGRMGALASDELAGAVAADHGFTIQASASGPLIGGMVINGPGTARQAIEPVLEVSGQALAGRDGGIVAQVCGRGPRVELDAAMLADQGAHILSRRRGDAAEKPARLGFGYFDRQKDYLVAHAMALRPGAGPLVNETLAMALDGAGARRAAEHLLGRRANAGDRIELSLPPGQSALEPGDRFAMAGLVAGPCEITEIRDGAVRRVVASAIAARDAIASDADTPRGAIAAPNVTVTPVLAVAHLPPLPSDPAHSRLAIAAYARPWPGAVRIADADSGAVLVELRRPAAIGVTTAPLGGGPIALWDRGGALEIELSSGHLADVAEPSALAGNNRVAVETDAGAWEVIGFVRSALISPRRYRLTRLLRGLEGTDAAVGPISAGRGVIVLDGNAAMLPVEAHQIGESRSLRCYAGPADASGQVLAVSLEAHPALPLAPVHLQAARQDDGAIAFGWTRRSRADGDGWGMAEPLNEHQPERWRVQIFEGGTSVRIIETGSASAQYGLGEQEADFSGPAGAFTFTVAQFSPALGAGHAASGAFDG